MLQQAVTEVFVLISVKKDNYFKRVTRKLADPLTCSKTYWFLLRHSTFNISLILPFLIDNKLELDFNETWALFLATKVAPVNNSNALPMPVNVNSTTSLGNNFNDDDLLKTIKDLDFNKTCDHDNLSMRTTKIRDSAITLSITVKSCIAPWIFLDIWEKMNIVPVHKEGNKQIVDN